jgi:hypothetical protein
MTKSKLIIPIIFFCLLIIISSKLCTSSFKTKSGKTYKASNLQSAEILDTLRVIAIDLSYEIEANRGNLLRKKLQNTSYKELIDQEDNILAWNYDKGREIGFKLYQDNGMYYPADHIIESLFHELAHSVSKTVGHDTEWKSNYNYLLKYKTKYTDILRKKNKILN